MLVLFSMLVFDTFSIFHDIFNSRIFDILDIFTFRILYVLLRRFFLPMDPSSSGRNDLSFCTAVEAAPLAHFPWFSLFQQLVFSPLKSFWEVSQFAHNTTITRPMFIDCCLLHPGIFRYLVFCRQPAEHPGRRR